MNIHLPKIVTARDYHDFNHMYDTFQIISKDIRVEEVGFCAPLYIGVIYDKNNVPSSKNVLELVEKAGHHIDKDDWTYE